MGFADSVKKDFTSSTLALMPLAICLNIVVGQIVAVLKLPVYLDTIGSILVGMVCGPWAGAVTGALSNIIWGLFSPDALPFFPVAAWIGFMAGLCGIWGLYSAWWKVLLAGLAIALTTPFVATPIVVYIYGGVEGSGPALITAVLIKSGMKVTSAAFYKNLMVEPLDKIPSTFIAYLLVRRMPARLSARFPRIAGVA